MEYNICRFLKTKALEEPLKIINLVYETETDNNVSLHSIATYRMHYITSGKGILHTEKEAFLLEKGDILIIPPAVHYDIENTENIKFIYISYFGIKANALADQFKIYSKCLKYSNLHSLGEMWQSLFDVPDDMAIVRCESVMLYTLSEIGKRSSTPYIQKESNSTASTIKKYIDENFTDQALNIKQISETFSYHPKYISSAFKKEYNTCLTDYIKNLRIQNACTLFRQGITSIKTVSLLCGYSDPLYFSTVFKKQKGVAPKEYISEMMK